MTTLLLVGMAAGGTILAAGWLALTLVRRVRSRGIVTWDPRDPWHPDWSAS